VTTRATTSPVPSDRLQSPRPWWLGPVLLAVLLPGCAQKHGRGPTTLDATATTDDLAALEQQLTAREGQLRSVGVAVAQAPPEPNRDIAKEERMQKKAGGEAAGPAEAAPPATPQPAAPVTSAGADASYGDEAPISEKPEATGGRCMQVCEISAAICGLQDQICGLVPRHRDDPRYQAACDRAVADCRLSTEACHGCS